MSGFLYRALFRPLLFRLDPETSHRLALRALPLLPRRPPGRSTRLETDLAGFTLPNPIGLAAGFDKDGVWGERAGRLGFGHIEVGTVTPRPQEGNRRPRLFRYPAVEAIVNRMGFNNEGADATAERLSRGMPAGERSILVGVNIGKQRETPIEEAAADYREAAVALLPHADYIVVNISSPNTPGLRSLEDEALLVPLLREVRRVAVEAGFADESAMRRVPLFVKLSPDLEKARLEAAIGGAADAGFDGAVLTNTTLDHAALGDTKGEEGGLSGKPLRAKALEAIRIARQAAPGQLTLIGVGGVFDGMDAYARIRAGASAVQLYTALIYRGPGLAGTIAARLDQLLERDGFTCVAEAVGTE